MTKPELVSARCRNCGRVYCKVTIQDWKRAVRPLHGVICACCGSRADASDAKST